MSRLWRRWLRDEAPARRLLRWSRVQLSAVLVMCLAVAMVSSLPWLLKPDLQPGSLAPFDAVAPKAALVQDSAALEQRRSSLLARSVVQVIDRQQTLELKQRLERQLGELQQVGMTGSAARVGPVNLDANEQRWLQERSQNDRLVWDDALRRAADRMLSQGLVSGLADGQLREAVRLQVRDLVTEEPAARSLAAKLP